MNQQQHQIDIDEARVLLSLKDDQIRNVTTSMKMLQRKTSIRMKELQYLMDQQKQKVMKAEKRYQKLLQSHNQQKVALLSQITVYKEQILRLTQSHQKQIRFYSQQMINMKQSNEQLTKSQSQLYKQIKSIQSVFNLQKVLDTLGQENVMQIPNYLQLYFKYLQRDEEVQELNQQVEKMKSQHLTTLKQSFQKQKRIEALIQNLKQQNQEGVKINAEKEMEASMYLSEIYQKSHEFDLLKDQNNYHLNQLRDEIANLQINLKNYQQNKCQLEETQRTCKIYAEAIGELKVRLELKQNEMEELITQYDNKILSIEKENSQLRRQLQKSILSNHQQINNCKAIILNLQSSVIEKQQMIISINNSSRTIQIISNQRKANLQKCYQQLNQLKQTQEREQNDRALNEELYQIRLNGLSQEISILNQKLYMPNSLNLPQEIDFRHINNYTKNSQSSNQNKSAKNRRRKQSTTVCPKSLLVDIGDRLEQDTWDQVNQTNIVHYKAQSNWAQLYYNLLKRHNEFSKKIHAKLSKITKKVK